MTTHNAIPTPLLLARRACEVVHPSRGIGPSVDPDERQMQMDAAWAQHEQRPTGPGDILLFGSRS